MARVLYGVMGNTFGHVSRALAVTGRLTDHEFHFVGGGRVPEILRGQYPVLKVPVAHTVYQNHRVSVPRTCGHLARCVASITRVNRQILDLIDHWQPDVAICDREFFLPHAAHRAGLPIFSLDHSHVLQVCRYDVPASQAISWSLARLEDTLFFNNTRHNLVTSFFHLELKPGGQNELLPPVLRAAVREHRAATGDYVFIYQTTPTFGALIDVARQIKRPVVVYGFRNEKATEGNLTFKPFDKDAILADLAGSCYAVVNAGHNLICEALFFGKPLLCFPIANTFEQFINARYVRELGYGDFSLGFHPTPDAFANFEARLDEYRRNVQTKFIDGTDAVTSRVRELIESYSRKRQP
ncbi:MAG TPA: glycosyltransferase family protein [Verrucomicrobiae bacterium]|nr:glycosyltransferase family protein [Verrucomicrobiae bacterium]